MLLLSPTTGFSIAGVADMSSSVVQTFVSVSAAGEGVVGPGPPTRLWLYALVGMVICGEMIVNDGLGFSSEGVENKTFPTMRNGTESAPEHSRPKHPVTNHMQSTSMLQSCPSKQPMPLP